jgi:two-component system chemotaxis response regulator CheB
MLLHYFPTIKSTAGIDCLEWSLTEKAMGPDNKVIVIGASTGGLSALKQIFTALPADLPAAIFAVLHIGPGESILPKLLGSVSPLPVVHATDGAQVEAGKVFIAPPDHHLLLEDGRMRLTRTAKENHARPAIDPLFRSAALAYRRNVVGVVLTGNLDDGTVGLQAVKAYGGTAVVQDPADAQVPSMPLSASRYVDTDYCVPLAEIAPTLVSLARERGAKGETMHEDKAVEVETLAALTGRNTEEEMDAIGTRSTQTCPDCGGTIWTIGDSSPPRFRCHTGHAFTAESMLYAQDTFTEQALWAAIRSLHERHTLLTRLADGAKEQGFNKQAEEYEASAKIAAEHAEVLRQMITS